MTEWFKGVQGDAEKFQLVKLENVQIVVNGFLFGIM